MLLDYYYTQELKINRQFYPGKRWKFQTMRLNVGRALRKFLVALETKQTNV